jgi:hypothetical protein
MMLKVPIIAVALGSAPSAPASAMTIYDLVGATSGNIERVVWVCGPQHLCWTQHGKDLSWAPWYGWNLPRGQKPRFRFGARGFWHHQ